jgi:hypothetical protein
LSASTTTPDPNDITSDLRVIAYSLVGGSGSSQGLARKEFTQATNDYVNTYPSQLGDLQNNLIAPEVFDLKFEYSPDTSSTDNWQSSWDGTTLSTDGVTPIGPPRAVRITLTLRKSFQNTPGNQGYNSAGAVYQHIVAMPTANFFGQAQTSNSYP